MTITDRRGRTVDGTDSSAQPGDPNAFRAIKQACIVATTANITLSGLQTIDGVTVAENDRVLVKDQTDGEDNGIYNASSGNWTRAVDWDGTHEIARGTIVLITTGTLNALKTFSIRTADPLVIGETSLTISELGPGPELAAIGALSTTGLIARTGVATYATRTVTGTANEITVTNGSGVSGNPTLSLPSALTFTGKTVTGGTFDTITATGTWAASGTWTIPAVTLGGTVSGGGNQINNVIIGTSTPLAGSFTTLTASGVVSFTGGAATVSATAADALLALNKPAGAYANVFSGATASSTRWAFLLGGSGTESGSNAGSDFALYRYADNGTYLDTVLSVVRSTGNITLVSTTASTSSTTGALIVSGGVGIAGAVNTGSTLAVASGSLSNGVSALTVTGTQPASPSAQQNGLSITITGAGSASQVNTAALVSYAAGYTGSSRTAAMEFNNSNAGTGSTLVPAAGSNSFVGNVGGFSNASATTTGLNIGLGGRSANGNVNAGILGIAQALKNSATNLGVVGSALNTGTSPVHVGGFFSLNQTTVPTVSAALIADNGSQTDAIFLARDNGSTVFTIADGGAVTATGALIAGSLSAGSPLTKTADWTVGAAENVFISDRGATNTVTLPSAASYPGRMLYFKTIQAFTVVSNASNVVPNTTTTAGTAILPATDGAWAILVSDGTNWITMASSTIA